MIHEGEGFGEFALVRNTTRSRTVYCATDRCEAI